MKACEPFFGNKDSRTRLCKGNMIVLLLSIIGSGHYAFNLPNMLFWKVTRPIVLGSFPGHVGGLGMRLLLCLLT